MDDSVHSAAFHCKDRDLGISKETWIDCAFESVSLAGESGLRVEKLAEKLSVAKSGFYYHFEDRDDFFQQVLERWKETSTDEVIDAANEFREPIDQLRYIFHTVAGSQLPRSDEAFRLLARQDDKAKVMVDLVDRIRLDFFRQRLKKLGFKGADLERRTKACFSFLMGFASSDSVRYVKPHVEWMLELLTTPSGLRSVELPFKFRRS